VLDDEEAILGELQDDDERAAGETEHENPAQRSPARVWRGRSRGR
jgi:hypothetical protein